MTQDEQTLRLISVSHGQARWLLKHFNMLSGEAEPAFDAFIKSLRRDGVPFADDELGQGRGINVTYRYEHLMELALAMTLRTQGIIARDIVRLIPRNREALRHAFKRAFLERECGLGAPRRVFITPPLGGHHDAAGVTMADLKELDQVSGIYLDLKIIYTMGGGPAVLNLELLGPADAVEAFMVGHRNLYPRPPIPISDIAADIVRLAQGPIPEFKRGRG